MCRRATTCGCSPTACCSSASGARSATPSSAAPSPRSAPASRARSTTASRSTCSPSRRTPRCSRPAPTRRRRSRGSRRLRSLAQQEARYAILALSSASGRSPFDAALRRYVDVLTADGELEVDLTIDPSITLGPDEQIEVFRIVQESLANVAQARRRPARVGRDRRARRRAVRARDATTAPASSSTARARGQGLRNMRERAATIGGAFSLRSTPGAGTALEIVLRA